MRVTVQPEFKLEFRECAAGLDYSTLCTLGEQEVHVWHAGLDPASPEVPGLERLLSGDERERAGRFRFERLRDNFIFGRGMLRTLLGSYLRAAPAGLRLTNSAQGKPSLATASTLAFNLSHTEGLIVFAFTLQRRIGVDVERVRRDFDVAEIADRFFSASECLVLRSLPAQEQPEAFFRCWTRKEAFIKALGEGLSHPLHRFDVSLGPDEPAALLATRPEPGEADRWRLRALPGKSGYAGALVVEADGVSGEKSQPPDR